MVILMVLLVPVKTRCGESIDRAWRLSWAFQAFYTRTVAGSRP